MMPVKQARPALPDDSGRDATHYCHWRYIMGHNGAGRYHRASANSHSGQNHCPRRNPHIVFDNYIAALGFISIRIRVMFKSKNEDFLRDIDAITDNNLAHTPIEETVAINYAITSNANLIPARGAIQQTCSAEYVTT
jgi:hypothetical protein